MIKLLYLGSILIVITFVFIYDNEKWIIHLTYGAMKMT